MARKRQHADQKSIESIWKKEYFHPAYPGAYSGASAYLRHASTLPQHKSRLKQWLQQQDTYTLHHPTRQKFLRRSIVVSGPYDQWQADLCDLSRFKNVNSGHRYILTVIDVFSKVAYARALKNKTSAALIEAFADILRLNSPSTSSTSSPPPGVPHKRRQLIHRPLNTHLRKKRRRDIFD